MANSESKRLAVDVVARIDRLEKAMARAASVTDRQTGKMERSTRQMRSRVESNMTAMASKVGVLAGRMFAPLAGAGAAAALRDAARGIAEIGDQARRAGVDVEAFSEWRYIAERNRIAVDAMGDAFREVAIRADELIHTGGGGGAEAFARLGYTADELAQKLQNPSELMLEIIERTRELGDVAAQQRIFDELFGGQGAEQMIRLLGQSTAEIRATGQAARDAGVVINDELVAKANDLDRAFQNVATTVGSTLQNAIVNAGWALYDFMQQFQAVENRTTASLEAKTRELGEQRVLLEAAILEQESMLRNMRPDTPGAIGGPRAGLEASIADLRAQMDEINRQDAEINAILTSRTPVEPPRPHITVGGGGGDGGGGGGGGGGTSAIIAQRDAVAELIAQLEHERSLLGMSNVEREVANALRQAGATATEQERQQIIGLVTAISAETEAIEKTQQAMEELADVGRNALQGIVQGFIEGKSAAEVFSSVLGNIGNQLLNMGLGAPTGDLFTINLEVAA